MAIMHMENTNLSLKLQEAKVIAEHLHLLLNEDALHRLELYQKYSEDPEASRWSPDLHKRCVLIEALRKKLEDSIEA